MSGHVTYSTHCVADSIQCATDSIQCALHDTHCAAYSCNVHHTAFNVEYTAFNVEHTAQRVQWASECSIELCVACTQAIPVVHEWTLSKAEQQKGWNHTACIKKQKKNKGIL